MTIGAGGLAAGAGTMALFSDTETSSGNTVQAGTLDLEYGGTGSFSFNTDLAPGDSTTASVTLVSSGTLSGSLDVAVTFTENDSAGASSPNVGKDEFAQNLNIILLTYGGTDITGPLPSNPTLYDLANQDAETDGDDLVDLSDPTSSGSDFVIELELDSGVQNKFQGEGLDIKFTFDLNQKDSQ